MNVGRWQVGGTTWRFWRWRFGSMAVAEVLRQFIPPPPGTPGFAWWFALGPFYVSRPLPTVDARGIITRGKCPACRAGVGFAHKMSCGYGTGKGLRLYTTRRGDVP